MYRTDLLQQIVAHKKKCLKQKKDFATGLKKNVSKATLSRYHLFKNAISVGGRINLIAELKKASPSRGVIRKDFDILKIAKSYVDNDAAALSVLTEEKFFLGKPRNLQTIASNYKIPLLAKDFFVDEVQIFEAFTLGASAILLIVAILKDEEIRHFLEVAGKLDLDCLVEVHDEKELERALKCGAEIIGVNNRNLNTFQVDLSVSQNLIPMIPEDRMKVSESGIKTHSELEMLKNIGANAVLIGETFLQEANIDAKVKQVMQG